MANLSITPETGNWAKICLLNVQLTRKLEKIQKALDACTIYEDYTDNNVYLNPVLSNQFILLSEVIGDIENNIPDYSQEANEALEEFVQAEISEYEKQIEQ